MDTNKGENRSVMIRLENDIFECAAREAREVGLKPGQRIRQVVLMHYRDVLRNATERKAAANA